MPASEKPLFKKNKLDENELDENELFLFLQQEANDTSPENNLSKKLEQADDNKQSQLTLAIAALEKYANEEETDSRQKAILKSYCSKTRRAVFTPETIHFATEATLRILSQKKHPQIYAARQPDDNTNQQFCKIAIQNAHPVDFNKKNFFIGLALLALGVGITIVSGCDLGVSLGSTALFAVTLAKANIAATAVASFCLALKLLLKSFDTKKILWSLTGLSVVAAGAVGAGNDAAALLRPLTPPPTPVLVKATADISIVSSALTALVGFGMFCKGAQMMWQACASQYAGKTYQDTAKRALSLG